MNLDHADTLGTALLVLIGLLSTYLLVLRIREYFQETPDPKLTYATLDEHHKVREHLQHIQQETKRDLENLRSENKSDHETLDRRRSQAIAGAHELIRKNAEHISSLIAHNQIAHQRLAELSLKTDKLLARSRHE